MWTVGTSLQRCGKKINKKNQRFTKEDIILRWEDGMCADDLKLENMETEHSSTGPVY